MLLKVKLAYQASLMSLKIALLNSKLQLPSDQYLLLLKLIALYSNSTLVVLLRALAVALTLTMVSWLLVMELRMDKTIGS